MATKAEDDGAAYLASCAHWAEVWERVCAEVEAKMTPEELEYAAESKAAAEMQI